MDYLNAKFDEFWPSVEMQFTPSQKDVVRTACLHWYSMGLRRGPNSAEAIEPAPMPDPTVEPPTAPLPGLNNAWPSLANFPKDS